MKDYQPTISVIVPVIPGGDVSITIDSVARVKYPSDKIEVIVVEGRNPSHQRNEAAKTAQGEILYFLDNDVDIDKKLFRNVVEIFEDESVSVVGGPTVTPETDSLKQQCFGYVLGSVFGAYIARERYVPLGLIRDATERELILCNMAIRRETFIEEGGFNIDLYPNEENELLNRFGLKKHRCIYHPLAFVYRSQPETFRQFCRMIFNYGRGRFEHLLLMPHFMKPVFAAPSLFVLYLLSLLFLPINPYYLLPLCVYVITLGFATFAIILGVGKASLAYYLPVGFICLHISYGLGFMWGAFKSAFRIAHQRDSVVNIRKLKEFQSDLVLG